MDARGRLGLVLAGAVAAGCAGPQGPGRAPETPAAVARPEPDPACHGTVQGLLARSGLDLVTVKVTIDAAGRPELVEVLAPDLTPSQKVELQRAFAGCAWAPRPAEGGAQVFTTTWVRERK
jgi:hypothetical protein